MTGDIDLIRPSDIPAPPQVVMQIIAAATRSDTSTRELVRIVSSEPSLTAELLRSVNSAFFGLAREITSPAHAVVVLGREALRNFALCYSVRESLQARHVKGIDLMTWWEDALRRAVAARTLSSVVGVDPDDAFTIGLLQELPWLALFIAHPDKTKLWEQARRLDPDARREFEQRHFGLTHDRAAQVLTEAWALPEDVAIPLGWHHDPESPAVPRRLRNICAVGGCADWMAVVYTAKDKTATLARCREQLATYFGVDADKAGCMVAELSVGVEEAARVLGIDLRAQPALEDLLAQSSRRLVEEHLHYSRLAWRLEKALLEKERLAARLEASNRRLESLVHYDPLTGLGNRRRLDRLFFAEASRHRRSRKPLSFVIMDLDNFKHLNDSHGHSFGDNALSSVAQVLEATLRTSDIAVRLGGDEMCVILPETDRLGGIRAAERLREVIAMLSLTTPAGETHITASFGGSTWTQERQDIPLKELPKWLFDAADAALYTAKHQGRNQVSWQSAPVNSSQADEVSS